MIKFKLLPFIASLILTFTLTYLVNYPPKLVSPAPWKIEAWESVLPKLKFKQNDFQLNYNQELVSSVLANEEINEYQSSRAYISVDYDTGEVILAKGASDKVSIASITKVMTAVVALDLAKPEEQFTVTETGANQIPTRLVLTPGESYSLKELLTASLIASANDCTQVIMEGIDTKYGANVFIQAMNAKAKQIGMKNTNFANPQGFDDSNHYGSAEDLAILVRYALTHYPLIASIAADDYELIPETKTHVQHKVYNWNGLLGVYPGVKGVKIGNTDAAGTTTSVVSQREGKRIIAVLLGAPGVLERDLWTAKLLDDSFAKHNSLEPVKITEEMLIAKYATWRYGD